MNNDDLRFAHTLADAADAVTTARFRALDLRVDTKPDLTPVSEADRRAEEVIRELVDVSGRGEGVLGEEFGDDGGDVKWIVDPIDGTKNYVRGVPIWATLLALEREGAVELAYVSAPDEIEHAAVSTTSNRRMPDGWRTIIQRSWSNRGLGDFWQHCLVAEGSLEIACDSVMEIWDYSAPRLLIEEAGGLCTTFTGEPPAKGKSFVSTNGVLHEEAVSLLST
jgi:histidinol-phosphatase